MIRLNPDITANPGPADDVLYHLRAIVISVQLMPFGANGEHVTIRLIDFENVGNNSFVVTQQFTIRTRKTEKRADLVFLVNGIPLVLIEAKTQPELAGPYRRLAGA